MLFCENLRRGALVEARAAKEFSSRQMNNYGAAPAVPSSQFVSQRGPRGGGFRRTLGLAALGTAGVIFYLTSVHSPHTTNPASLSYGGVGEAASGHSEFLSFSEVLLLTTLPLIGLLA